MEPIKKKEVQPKRVKLIRCHIAIMLTGGIAANTIESEKHKVEMEVLPMGIKLTKAGKVKVVPYANIHEFELYPEEV